jgi:hypothetical protein
MGCYFERKLFQERFAPEHPMIKHVAYHGERELPNHQNYTSMMGILHIQPWDLEKDS